MSRAAEEKIQKHNKTIQFCDLPVVTTQAAELSRDSGAPRCDSRAGRWLRAHWLCSSPRWALLLRRDTATRGATQSSELHPARSQTQHTHSSEPRNGGRYASQLEHADTVQAPFPSCLHLKIRFWGVTRFVLVVCFLFSG